MPSRLLREGILDSEPVNSLSWPAEVFYRRLMSVVDDYGRFDGRPAVLRSRLYPLKIDTVREADISRWIAECETAGLIALYAVESRPYILFPKLGAPRAAKSKYPDPPVGGCGGVNAGADVGTQPFTSVNGGSQSSTVAPYSGSGASSNSGSIDPLNPPAGGRRKRSPAVADHPLFERFWAAYPKHADRQAASKAFTALDPDEATLAKMLAAIEAQGLPAKFRAEGGKYIKNASGWLNGRRWEDDPQALANGTAAARSGFAPRGQAETQYAVDLIADALRDDP